MQRGLEPLVPREIQIKTILKPTCTVEIKETENICKNGEHLVIS